MPAGRIFVADKGDIRIMEVYLDNAATTLPFPEVRDIMMDTLQKHYGNPSSKHIMGMDAENFVKDARKKIAASMKAEEKEIFFTSGGTESNNQALIATAFANQRSGKHIISTRIEHSSVYNPLCFLEEEGFEVTYLNVDQNGHILLDEFEESIRDDTILVSVMYVNNEIGTVQDIAKISEIIKEKKKDIIFHVDAIQAYGKYKIYPKKLGIDLLSVSGHKIHGPKGIGFLYIRDKVKIKPFILGGGQQKGMRSGTENVPGIAGLGKAAELIYHNHEEKMQSMYELKAYFVQKLLEIDGIFINGLENLEIKETSPSIISASVEGIRSEVLLHALADRGIYVSSGSACSSNHPALSGTLQAIGVKKELLDSTIRFSLSVYSTKEEVEYTISVLKELLPMLRRYRRQ